MYHNILLATDLVSEHTHICKKAAFIAKQFNANLYIMHVIEFPASIQIAQGLGFTELAEPSKEDAQTVLSLLGEELQIPAEQQLVEIGPIKDTVLHKASELNCGLIIIGSHSNKGIEQLLGNNASSIINHATCDVVTLRV
jgi:nucleotide-binding universal stress UspA family protein